MQWWISIHTPEQSKKLLSDSIKIIPNLLPIKWVIPHLQFRYVLPPYLSHFFHSMGSRHHCHWSMMQRQFWVKLRVFSTNIFEFHQSIQWQSQKFTFRGAKHKIRQLIFFFVYILIISILIVMYIQFNNQNSKVYYSWITIS